MYNELKDLGVIFVSKNEQFDTSTAMGEAMLKIILVFAELERNMTSERVTATMISRASNGQWNGGRIPYGYDYNLESKEFSINPEESEVVKIMHDLYEQERSLVRIARHLNEKGFRSRNGLEWSPTTLLIILRNVFYCGDYRYNVLKEGDRQKVKDKAEWITVENHHPAIISKEQKERIAAILDENNRLTNRKNLYKSAKRIHVFAGLMQCGNCGRPMGATPQSPKKDWQYSKYSCSTRRHSAVACNGKFTSDPIVGEFVINYILNMLNSQKKFDTIHSPVELQNNLLLGTTFKEIESIDTDGLHDLYNVLIEGNVTGEVYGKGAKIKPKKTVESDTSKLRNEKQKLKRALDRLTNLYLYSDDAMSQSEFIVQKAKLTDSIDEIDEQIGLASSDEWNQSVSDEIFINRASEFIIAQKLSGRNYVCYKNLAMTVDLEVLQSFFRSVIDSIIMDTGRVKQIIFKNGLSHTFNYK